MLSATLLKNVVVVSPVVGVYTSVVTGGMVFSKFVPDVRVCQLYEIVPIVAVADKTLENAGGISFGQSVEETCPIVPLTSMSL